MTANTEAQQVPQQVPTGALIGAAMLIAVSMAFAFVARTTDIGATRLTPSATLETLSLRFNDLADGSIGVYDTVKQRNIDVLVPGKNGFVRVVMRGLAQDRAVNGIGPDVPFTLNRRADGRLVLIDPTSGRIVTLEAFGSGNYASFEALFNKGRQQQ
jgi:putative photosynthetic complex assembly protein